MAAQYTTLNLVGQYGTINLLDDVNYMLVSWSPAVAARERAIVGNYTPYTNVVETITVNVYGTSASDALEALEALNNVLEQAESWYLGEGVPPVLIQVQIVGSALADPLEAVVLGRADGDTSWMRLQPTFNDDLTMYEIRDVELTFLRRGLWLGETSAEVAVQPLANPAVMTVDMGERLDRLSPTTVKITDFDSGTTLIDDGFLIVTGSTVRSTYGYNVHIFDTSHMTSTEFSSTLDSTNNAHGDYVMRIDASTDQTGTIAIADVAAEKSRISLFAAIRNNSATSTWEVRPQSTGYVTSTDRWRKIDASSQQPRIIYLGSLANQAGQHLHLNLDFTTSDSTGTLDINYVVVVGHDPSTQYISFSGDAYSTESFARSLVVDPRATTHRTPLMYIETEVN